jgi:hypothetical protein
MMAKEREMVKLGENLSDHANHYPLAVGLPLGDCFSSVACLDGLIDHHTIIHNAIVLPIQSIVRSKKLLAAIYIRGLSFFSYRRIT